MATDLFAGQVEVILDSTCVLLFGYGCRNVPSDGQLIL